MSQDALTLYKLIVLYMLNLVDFPLNNSQVSDFILEKGYTNYMTLQQVIAELAETKLIETKVTLNRTQLVITEEGRNTLQFFEKRIGNPIKADIKKFFREHELDLRNEVSIRANYYKSVNGEYEAQLIAKEKEINLIDLKLSLPTEELAAVVCEHWQERNQTIYKYLMEMLF